MGMLGVLRKLRRREREMRVLVLGLDNAGKTTLVAALRGDAPLDGGGGADIAPTVGFRIDTLQLGAYQLHVWDVGGQRALRTYWRNYFEHTDGLVFVVDAADPARWPEALVDDPHRLVPQYLYSQESDIIGK